MNTSFDPFPKLVTNRLVLRQIGHGDAEQVLFLRSDETVLQYIDRTPVLSLQEAAEFIDRIMQQEKNGECVTWAMVPKDATQMIGSICFWNLEKERSKAEVGYSMYPDYYGMGLMQEAMAAVLAFGFDTMKMKVVEAITNRDNVRSRRLLERNNFTRDAQLEKERVGTEEPDDATIYTIRK